MKTNQITTAMNYSFFNIKLIVLSILFISATALHAQTGQYEILNTEYNNSDELFYFKPHPSWSMLPMENLPAIFSKIYKVSPGWTFKVKSREEDESGVYVKVIQSYNDIEVFGGDMILAYKEGQLQHVIGTVREFSKGNTVPGFSPDSALKIAYRASNSSRIQLDFNPETGERYEPVMRLLFSPMNGNLKGQYIFVYEVELVLLNPDRLFYYIDARTGEVIHHYSALMHGTGTSLYSGNKNINTVHQGNFWFLLDSARKIKCYDHRYNRFWLDFNDLQNHRPVQFPDANNNWADQFQKAAVDVHWGMGKVYDYYKNIHSRNSYDGNGSVIINRIHCDRVKFTDKLYPLDSITLMDSLWNNATWNGRNMSYGDGDGVTFSALVSLDIVGHEFTHAVIEKTAGLIYQGESGALNESFADMFGICIDFSAGSGNYQMGEQCYTPGTGGDNLRDISAPKTSGSSPGERQPDCYKGTYWAPTASGTPDEGGVHTNSGVGNFWFYLLCEGGAGTNDKNNAYDVTKIGMNDAQDIIYLALKRYMGSATDYRGARVATLLAAEQLYPDGKESTQYKQVCNAWYAVNVGEKCCPDSIELEFDVKDAKCVDSKDGEIKLTVKKSNGPFEYKWYKTDTISKVVFSTSKDLTGLDTGRYYAFVRDTVAKCEVVDMTEVFSPKKVEVSISGGGQNIQFRICDGAPSVTLAATGSGGTPPFTYNWPGGSKTVSSDGPQTAVATDKNGCKGEKTTVVSFVPVLCSRDPNDIVGPKSYGDKKFVARSATLQYKVRFENDPDFATAPASRVTVDLPIDNNMDMNTFKVGSFGFNSWVFTVPGNVSTYYKRLDLRDSLGIYVDVTAGIDQSSKKAFWIFESIDPATGLPPTSGALGFLPVNDTAKQNGEGFADFTIRAKNSTVTGDSLRASAEITFDDNSSINTPRIHNIIDAVAPVSVMDSMPANIDSTTFTLRFRTKDDNGGSGVNSTDLMVSENNGAYIAYQKNITDTFVVFSGYSGGFYQFYTQSSDNVANKEAAKPDPEISITITPKDFLRPLDSGLALCTSDTLPIRWKKVPINSFNLQYAVDTGQFTTFVTGLSGLDTMYNWKLPSVSSSSATIRIRAIGTTGMIYDETRSFILRPAPGVELGRDTFYCDGSSISIVLDAGPGYSSYLWSTSATSQTLSVNTEGTYSVIVSNSFGCTASDQVKVTKTLRPVISSKFITNISCFGNSNGSISLVTVSGTQPYNYLWSNSATTEDIAGLAGGTYTLLVTDARGCTVTDTSTITEPAKLVLSKFVLNVKCKNGNDGSIDLSVAGGTTSYSYLWSNSAGSQDINSLVAGSYSVLVTDANNCIIRDTTVITEPALLTSSKTFANVKCKNGFDGSIDLSVSGGVSPYTYLWSNSATSQDISGLVAGTYTVLITDANACLRRDTVVVTEPTLLVSSKTFANVKCKNGNDGSIDLTVNGGTTAYQYLWNNAATTQDISSLIAGTYTVRVTDANGCIVRDTVVITEPTLLVSSKTLQPVKCKNGNDGSIDLSVNGGTSPYTYLWSNAATTQDISSLIAGTYTVRITDANGCIRRDTGIVTEPPLLTASKALQHVKCKNGNDGSIDLTVNGGVTPYTYLWSNSATTQDISTLNAGTYIVRITDFNACILRDTTVITEPALLFSSKTFQNVKCKNGNDGSIDLTITGGVTPYTYVWSNSATTQDISGLIAGTYTVVVTDANACVRRDTVVITEPALLFSTKTFVDVKCKNNNTGSIDLTVTGGTSPYTYLWSNSATSQDINNITAGTYIVRITDANACIRRDTTVITEPTLLLSSKTSQNVKCKNGNNGSIDLTVSGGVSPYTYLWSNNATTEDISTLTAGTYIARITDFNGCIRRDTTIITEPALLFTTKTISNVKCKSGNTGSIDLTVTGGVSPYTYVWSNSATTQDISGLVAGTYIVTVTDANACVRKDTTVVTEPALLVSSKTFQNVKCKGDNTGSIDLSVTGGTTPYTYLWSNSATTQDIINLVAGTYTVRVTDFNSCIARDTVIITEPAKLVTSKTSQNVKCKNGNTGSIDLSVSGGVSTYTYLWSNSATTQDIINLFAGTYTVRVTDGNACIARDTVFVTEPPLLVSSKTFQNVKCKNGSDGSIDLTVSGGTGTYTYLWDNSATTQDISSLVAGRYTVEITDANGCIRRDTVFITEPPLLTRSHVFQNVKCKNGNTGSIDLSINGGTSPYIYLWSNGAGTQDISNLVAGTYTVEVFDANACIVRDTVIITEPALLVASRTFQDVKCKNGNTGSIDLSVTGGVSPYTYLWSNSAATQDLNNLFIGTYIVIVTDANACTDRDTVTIKEPSLLLSSITVNDVLCHAGSDGSINALGTGGTAPYTYLWSSGETISSISGKIKGVYIVRITDANNCVRRDTITIKEPAAPLTLSKILSNVKCHDGTDGQADLTVSGGTIPYTFTWNNGAVTEDEINVKEGTYTVLITDKNNCTLRDTSIITQPLAPLSNTISITDVKCFAGNDGAIDLNVAGGTIPYAYVWSNASVTEDLNGLAKGNYIVTVTDANNCLLTDTGIVNQPAAPLASVLTETNINCFGGNTGSIIATISGGTQPYNFNWSNGAITKDINTVPQGKYVITVTDFNNCILKDSITLTEPAAPLTALLVADDVNCYGDNTGSVTLTPSGGTPAYTYNWNNGAITQDITGLVKGMYKVTVTDNKSCTYNDSVFVPEPTELKLKAFATSATPNAANGTAWVEIAGGTLPYQTGWNDDRLQTNDTAVQLMIGVYIVTVTDGKGCITFDTVDVMHAPDPSAISIHPNPSAGTVVLSNLSALGLDEAIIVEIFDMNGKMFMNFEVLGKDIYSFDLYDSFSNSTYIIRVRNSRGIENRRLILIK